MLKRRLNWKKFLGIALFATYLYTKKAWFVGYFYLRPSYGPTVVTAKTSAVSFSEAFPNDVLEWMRVIPRQYGPVILNTESVTCLETGDLASCNSSLELKEYWFAVVRYQSGKIANVRSGALERIGSISKGLRWTALYAEVKQATKLKKSETTLKLSILEFRRRYIYIHGIQGSDSEDDHPRAFTPLNFTKYEYGGDNAIRILAPSPMEDYLWQWPRSRFLDCNRSSAAYLHAKHLDMYQHPPLVKPWTLLILAHCQDILLKARVTTVLDSGSALGWYRECGIIPHTHDMDLAFRASEWKPELEQELLSDRIVKVFLILGVVENSLEIMLRSGTTKIDLFGLYETVNYSYISGMLVDKRTPVRFISSPFTGACTCDLEGFLFYVRCDILDYLISVFGDGWYEHHLSKNYSWYQSPRNVLTGRKYNDTEWPYVYREFY